MGSRCRIPGVPDDEDNVYLSPSVVKQVISDITAKARYERRKMSCGFCNYKFIMRLIETEVCPKCRHEQPEASDQG